jgi:hypothetical protein
MVKQRKYPYQGLAVGKKIKTIIMNQVSKGKKHKLPAVL